MTRVIKIPVFLFSFVILGIFSNCQNEKTNDEDSLFQHPLTYAKGFIIEESDNYYLLKVQNAYPGSKEIYTYLVLKSKEASIPNLNYDAIIKLPVDNIVVTSTTHVPHLDLLKSSHQLKAFPNLNLISSEITRAFIHQNKIIELGTGTSANLEKIIELQPDWMMISTLGEELSHIQFLNKNGIAAVINGEYTEEHPLGRAEWIKFTGVLLGKLKEAEKIFGDIESEYQNALELTSSIPKQNRPSVLSGIMYKDTWFAPAQNSWGGQLVEAAGGKYVFEENKGIGSLQLNYEYVLEKALEADFWIGAADFSSLTSMTEADARYAQFKAVQQAQVYTYTLKKGATGGLEYFELGYMRPDLILKDLIKILHPNLLPDYSPYFYEKLNNE
jgi:iron complex transport system substrate-binding protein